MLLISVAFSVAVIILNQGSLNQVAHSASVVGEEVYVRLVNGSTAWEGRVEVSRKKSGPWGTVCSDLWDDDDATVVCQQSGLGQRGKSITGGVYGMGAGDIYLDDVLCRGNESSLAECRTHTAWGSHNCRHQDDAGVLCYDVEVRLVNGTTQSEGRVEVRKIGTSDWGTVCDDGWDYKDATVICWQLGLGQTGEGLGQAAYGEGSDPIYLDDVWCTGSEQGLKDCGAQPWGWHSYDCGHHKDAGVKCFSGCGAGLHFDKIQRKCTECPAGAYTPYPNMAACSVCPAGQYQDKTGQVSCIQCPFGQFQRQTGQSSCTPCPPGQYQSSTGESSCILCPPGQHQNLNGQTACKVCPAGQYQSLSGHASCMSCPKGHTQNLTGQASCNLCSTGQFQNITGQVSCNVCNKGHFQNATGQITCNSCSPGHYQSSSGQASCIACPAGYYQNLSGQTNCTPCAVGQYQKMTGKDSCTLCPPGEFQNAIGQDSCEACPAGHHQNMTGQQSCHMCPPGQFQNVSGQASCTECPEGWFQKLPEQTSCTPCFPGHHQDSPGKDICITCPIGQHQPLDGRKLCSACPAGQYQDHIGQSSCTACPDGTSTSSRGATHRENCTETPLPTSTVTVTLSYTLLVVCTDDQAKEVRTTLYTRVQRLDSSAPGVCVDLACSNAHVLAWCESYTAYVINSEITFENLPAEISTPEGSQMTAEDVLMQSVKQTAIFEEVIRGATLQKDKVVTSSKQTCPPGFVLSENVCEEDDNLAHRVGVVFGCVIAVVAIILLSVILYKLRRKTGLMASPPHFSEVEKSEKLSTHIAFKMRQGQGHSASRNSEKVNGEETYDIIPEDENVKSPQ